MPDLTRARWRKSSFSNASGECVEVAHLLDGTTAVRNSNDREAGTVFLARVQMAAFIKGVKAGEFDDLAT